MSRELGMTLHDRLREPVVMADELEQQYLFNVGQVLRLVVFLALAAVLYILVFTNDETVLRFLHPQNEEGVAPLSSRILAAIAVFLFIPVVAYLYGTASRLFLKLLRIE
jgi:hypothetical protein